MPAPLPRGSRSRQSGCLHRLHTVGHGLRGALQNNACSQAVLRLPNHNLAARVIKEMAEWRPHLTPSRRLKRQCSSGCAQQARRQHRAVQGANSGVPAPSCARGQRRDATKLEAGELVERRTTGCAGSAGGWSLGPRLPPGAPAEMLCARPPHWADGLPVAWPAAAGPYLPDCGTVTMCTRVCSAARRTVVTSCSEWREGQGGGEGGTALSRGCWWEPGGRDRRRCCSPRAVPPAHQDHTVRCADERNRATPSA